MFRMLNAIIKSNRDPTSFSEQSGDAEQSVLDQDCSPWMPATHPDGALYFYDQERVRASLTWKPLSYN